jgi:hypothetical protein
LHQLWGKLATEETKENFLQVYEQLLFEFITTRSNQRKKRKAKKEKLHSFQQIVVFLVK